MTIRTHNKIGDGNRALAEFMGGTVISSEKYEMPHGSHSEGVMERWGGLTGIPSHDRELAEIGIFRYETSWNWIFPVIDKIESLGFNFSISRSGIQVVKWRRQGRFEATDLIIDEDFSDDYLGDHKRIAAWDSCVSFVNWYNKQNSKN
jgi:hypothetical protein